MTSFSTLQISKLKEMPTNNIGDVLLEHFKEMDSYDKGTLLEHNHYKKILAIIEHRSEASQFQDIINDSEGDIIMTQQERIPIDPITKKEVTDPVRNKICKHIYDRKSIIQHMARLKKNCRYV